MTAKTKTRSEARRHRVAPVLLVGVLAACGGGPPPGDAAAPTPDAPAANGQPATGTGSAAAVPAGSLPPTRMLEVTVEGQTELREARLFESPQGYAIHVLPQLVMTPEEPCCDIAWARVDDGFFMRIERIDPELDLARLREDIALALSAIGEPQAVPADRNGALESGETELQMRAVGRGVSSTMLVARIDGGRYRVTLHLPHREALEGIPASMWAMLGSLRTTGPWDRDAGTPPR